MSSLHQEWPKITLFGDSMTRRSFEVENGCWASMVAHQVNNYYDVDARGFEGYNSKLGFELMPKLFPKSYLDKVEVFVVFFGHNDSWQDAPLGLSPDEYDAHMRKIVKHLTDSGLDASKIIVVTPAWYHDEVFQVFLKESKFPPFGKSLEWAQKYADIAKQVATDCHIELVDFFALTAKYEPLAELFCDGVHLSRKGAKYLFDALMPVIEQKITKRHNKPLNNLWHAIPIEQIPALKAVIQAYHEQLQSGTDDK